MAQKICFFYDINKFYVEKIVEFDYVKGMAFSQKQKNVKSFHLSIAQKFPGKKILEISTKSDNDLGISLSAFNLKLNGKSLESIYQSAKVFENDEQFSFLADYSPKEAHKFISERQLGGLSKFRYENVDFPLEPKTLFYDYIYIKALSKIPHISNKIVEYDIFTDIEFNEKRQVNCQARACAIYCSLIKMNKLDKYLSTIEEFKKIYGDQGKQLSLFDF